MPNGPSRRVRPRPKAETNVAGSRQTSSSFTHRRSKLDETSTREELAQQTFPPGVEPAFVRVSVGNTYNMGDFNSLRIDVSVTLPCLPSEVDDAYNQASEFCAEKMREEELQWMGER